MKRIIRQYSVARTPQQNRVAKRRNKTLIEAARNMLVDSIIVLKKKSSIYISTASIGKFDGKADEGFFVRHSLNSKAFRVFNNRTRIVEENLHIRFNKNTPNIVGSGPNWLFDINALTNLMNYKPVVTGNQSNGNAGTKACDDVESKSSQDDGFQYLSDGGKKVDEDLRQENKCKDQEKENNVNNTNNVNPNGTNKLNAVVANTNNELPFDLEMHALEDISTFNFSSDQEDVDEEADMNNMNTTIQVSHTPTTRIHKDHQFDQVIRDLYSTTQTKNMSKNLEDHGFCGVPDGSRVLFFMERLKKRYMFCQPPGFEDPDFLDKVYKVKKALYGLHQAPRALYETLLTYLLDNEFHKGKIYKTLFIRRHKDDILLVQVYVDDIIFGLTKKELLKQKQDGISISHDKYVAKILKKYGFLEVKNASTPMETQKPLLKDKDSKEVDVHMYRSMIGSLMHLTSSRPDIMFAVCTCARYQVNLKVSYLYAVKSIFRKSRRNDIKLPQTSVPTSVVDKAIKEEMDDSLERAATSLDAEQNSGNINKTQSKVIPNEPGFQGTKLDYQLAERMQVEEQHELNDEKKAKFFMQLLEKKRKFFATKRAEEKRNKPPTPAQQRKIMCTYLKNKEEKRTKLEQESAKKQKIDDDKDTAELQQLVKIIPDEEGVAIDAIPLAVKPPSIVDWKIQKEGKKNYYNIIRLMRV
nr:hypothetical protein [Tanacetum cinerariifolium]